MKGSISGIFLLLLIVSFCLKADSQRYTPAAILAVQIAMQRAEEAHDAIYGATPKEMDANLQAALRNCSEVFWTATVNLQMTIDDLRKGNFTAAPTLVADALRIGSTCSAAPMASRTAVFKESCSQALSIVNDVARQP